MRWARVALRVLGAMSLSLAAASVASAHHSATASYDADRSIDITGTVLEFSWKNPHCRISVNVTDGPFKGRTYAIEMSSPTVLSEEGWTRNALRAGDRVVARVHPSRAGTAVGLCRSCAFVINGTARTAQVLQNQGTVQPQ